MTPEKFKIEVLPWSIKLYPMVRKLLRSDSEAEDAVQDAILKLWRNRNKLKKIEKKDAYIIALFKNQCFDVLKKKRVLLNEHKLNNFPTQATDFESREKLEITHQIIESLPEKYREVIQLREIDGLDFEEIKEITNIDIPHIRVILSRARKKIKEGIQKVYNYESIGQKNTG